jgi:hypothetical protein
MLFITGDTHGSFERLSFANWPESRSLCRNDYIIVAGDFGLIFNNIQTKDERWWTDWLKDRPWTILFVCGNHENHPLLNALPREERFGGTVGVVANNIFHLRRGEIYTIDNRNILTFGGAASIDKASRVDGVSWWAEELPSYGDMENCIKSMEKHNYTVDFIIAHTCPQVVAQMLMARQGGYLHEDPTQKMLDHIISVCEFDHYFCGHFHQNMDIGKYHFLYTKIINVEQLIKDFNIPLED